MSINNTEINYDNLSKMAKLIKRKRSKKYYADRLGISVEEVGNLKRHIYRLQKNTRRKKNKNIEEQVRKEDVKKANLIKGTLESIKTVAFEPNDHKELAIVHNVDLDVFKITNYWSKLQRDGTYTSSIFCKRKTPADYSLEDFQGFLKKYKPNYITPKSPKKDSTKESVNLEISISDYHLAKKYITQSSAKVKDRADKFFEIVNNMISKCSAIYNIDKVVFPISNDFFHTDTYWNSTTNGTPQNVIAEFDEEYEVGFDVLVRSITLLKEHCKEVIVVLVPGNHDKTKSFYLAHALDVFFRASKGVSFIRESSPIKGLTLGNTFIGYHHGNCKIDELPLVFATSEEHSVDFGKSKYREVHTGDKHHYMAKEIKGVRIQQMPSMSGTDKWHRDSNYVNGIRAALVLVYDEEKGKIGEFEERI